MADCSEAASCEEQRRIFPQETLSTCAPSSSLGSDGYYDHGDIALPEPLSALPQLLEGEAVWAERWGVTPAQLGELLKRLRAEPGWSAGHNVYTMVNDYVVPWTRGTGQGYALSVNRDEPKEVNVMVSHAWGENAEEFLETLLRSCSDDEVLFVCCLSIYQPEDGVGPTIEQQLGSDPEESPFRRILEHLRLRGAAKSSLWRRYRRLALMRHPCLVAAAGVYWLPLAVSDCLPFFRQCAAYMPSAGSWAWRPLLWWPLWTISPIVLIIAAGLLNWIVPRYIYAGRMLVVPNREVDIYSRLWCVYEIFVAKHLEVPVQVARTLADGGQASCSVATCGSPDDLARIRAEIEAMTTYKVLDQAVHVTLHRVWWNVVLCSLLLGSTIAFFDIAFAMTFMLHCSKHSLLQLVPRYEIFMHWYGSLVFASIVVLAKTAAYVAMFSVFSYAEGVPTIQDVNRRGLAMMLAGAPVMCTAVAVCRLGMYGPALVGAFFTGLIWTGYGGGLCAYGLLLLHHAATFSRKVNRRRIICVGVGFFVSVCVARLHLDGLFGRPWSSPESRAHIYRLAFSSAALACGNIFLPTYIFWHTAHWWGFRVVRPPPLHADSDASVEFAACEDSFDSSSGEDDLSEIVCGL